MNLRIKIIAVTASVILLAGGVSTYLAHLGEKHACRQWFNNSAQYLVLSTKAVCTTFASTSLEQDKAQQSALRAVSAIRSHGLCAFVLGPDGRPLTVFSGRSEKQTNDDGKAVETFVRIAKASKSPGITLLQTKGNVFGFDREAVVAATRFQPWDWVIGVAGDPTAGVPSFLSAASSSWWLVLLTVAAAIGLSLVLMRLVFRPLRALAQAAHEASQGKSDVRIQIDADPEIQEIVSPVNCVIEQALDRAAELESFREAIVQPMLTVDTNLRITYANRALAETLGYATPEELIGKSYEELFGETSAKNARKIFETKQNIREIHKTLKSKDGQEIPVIGSGGCLHDRRGEPIGLVLTYVDLRSEYQRRQNYLQTEIAPIEKALLAVSEGDLTVDVPDVDTPEIRTLARALQQSIERIRSTIASVQAASQAVASATDDIASAVERQAEGTERQLRRSEEVAAAVAEMSQVVRETATNTANASHHADRSVQKAQEGADRVGKGILLLRDMVEILKISSKQLNHFLSSFNQIDSIVQMIEEIADRTNLLALNATIEAARAGEAGRGFSVVAGEIQKLAERTHTATAEIRKLVQEITASSSEIANTLSKGTAQGKEGEQMASESRQRMEEIVESAQIVQDMVRQIATAAEQQSATADEIAQNLNSIAEVARGSTKSAEQIRQAGEELRRLVAQLNAIVNLFRTSEKHQGDLPTAEADRTEVREVEVL